MLEEQTELENAMMRTPAVDACDLAARVLAYCHEGKAYLPNLPELWAEGTGAGRHALAAYAALAPI
jgi:hypothetical protein